MKGLVTEMSGNNKLVIKNLSKSFEVSGGVHALKDINLAVDETEFVVIVGPSGCGKSTLLNIIGGLETASAGTVELDGRIVKEPGADRGMVFQGYSLFPWLTVRKNVEFGLKMKGVSAKQREQTSREYLKLVGLEEFENALPRQLSGGMRQRAAIARTLANKPDVLLMDEPFGALDAQTRVVMQEFLASVARETKMTVIFVTHDIDEAILLADRIYVMSRRPGTIRDMIDVKMPQDRTRNILVAPEFLEIKKRIMDMLWQESVDAAMDR
jgi:NitT/TauT family transport system ATP-binding protein